jgi:hypothetical protein
VADAEQYADEMLRDARAVSAGLRQLGATLQDQAEKILRDVQAGHKRIRGDLRTVTGSSAPMSEESTRAVRSSPFEDLDVPSWAEKPSSKKR